MAADGGFEIATLDDGAVDWRWWSWCVEVRELGHK